MLFFGFCLGDAGYGLIILIGTTIYKFKAKEKIKPLLTLAQYLGLATVIFGILSGTLFGLNLIEDKSKILPPHIKELLFDSNEMFYFALFC